MTTRGRPVRDIVSTSAIVTELATDMVTTRKTKGMTLQSIAVASHYSISALSQATSGQCIPSLGVIRAYARALNVDPELWLTLRAKAVEERRRHQKNIKDGAPAENPGPPPASAGTSSSSADIVPAGRSRPALPVVTNWLGHHRETGTGGDAELDGVDAATAMRVQQLVTEAVEQATPQLHGYPIANVLSLCTVPGDLIEVLRETRERSAISLQEIARRTPASGVSISKTSLQKLLSSQDLPTAEVLRAVLIACEVPPHEIRFWLYHRARLELARERRAHRRDDPAARPVRTVSYGSRTQVRLAMTLPFLASVITLVVMFVQAR
ncbi:helix-turn-helix transcriptional regulator [Streptomyces sp. NPDC047860]|uniref:helix-turn-helix transcriptional regulator n=1 Tax=Streptomyces sp. NPDC047860 TaxID=3155743 RepID=UPI0033FC5E71